MISVVYCTLSALAFHCLDLMVYTVLDSFYCVVRFLSLLASYINLYTFVKFVKVESINTQILYNFVSCSVNLKVIIFVYLNAILRSYYACVNCYAFLSDVTSF